MLYVRRKMIPIILISPNPEETEKYLKQFIVSNSIRSANIFKVMPEKKEITVAQIREIKKSLTVNAHARLFVFYEFQHATNEAQNALLKSLEENSFSTYFVMITDNEYAPLPTIRSRSKIVRSLFKKKEDTKLDTDISQLLSLIETSQDYVFLSNALLNNLTREEVLELLNNIISYYREKLISFPIESTAILKKTMYLKRYEDNNNINPQLAFDILLIFIWKLFNMKL